MKPRKKTPQEEARAFDKARDKRNEDSEPLSKEQKEIARQAREARKLSDDRRKEDMLEPFYKISQDPLSYLRYLVEQGDFFGVEGRSRLFGVLAEVKTQLAMEELVSLLEKKK